jgi:small subunit ribosomal protein S6
LPARGAGYAATDPRIWASAAETIHKERKDVPYYENVFIARQEISPQQVESLADAFQKTIEEQGGKVPKKEHWGLRHLAFRIKKNRKGYYVLMNLDAPPAAVTELERQMSINEDVIRYLTVRVDGLEEGPSAVLQARHGHDDRPRREHGDRGWRDDRPRHRRGWGDAERGPSGGPDEARRGRKEPRGAPRLNAEPREPAPEPEER